MPTAVTAMVMTTDTTTKALDGEPLVDTYGFSGREILWQDMDPRDVDGVERRFLADPLLFKWKALGTIWLGGLSAGRTVLSKSDQNVQFRGELAREDRKQVRQPP